VGDREEVQMEHDDERRPESETVGMSKEDPRRTRLGAHLEDAEETVDDAANRPVPGTYTGEEADVTGRAEYADRPEPPADRPLYEDEPQRGDRSGGGGPPLLADEEDRLDRPLPHEEPGVERAPYERAADDAKRPRPADEG
jgi:hypothetical protein